MTFADRTSGTGLIVETELTHADGCAERAAVIGTIERHSAGSERRLALGADKGYDGRLRLGGYDAASFVADLRRTRVTPQFTSNMAACTLARLPRLLAA